MNNQKQDLEASLLNKEEDAELLSSVVERIGSCIDALMLGFGMGLGVGAGIGVIVLILRIIVAFDDDNYEFLID